jgi:hypothetical protein
VVVVVGLVVALAVAGLAVLYASGSPDGLDRVAIDHGLTDEEKAHQLDGSPLAGYETGGLTGPLSGGLAGLVGIGVTFVLAAGVAWLVRRRRPPAGAADPSIVRPGARPADRVAGRSVDAGDGRPDGPG